MNRQYDVAVIGAGVLGLAHAYALARRGLRVVVLERDVRAQGASVRNFGMLWPIGQPLGERYHLAQASRQRWVELLKASKLWYDPCGSLHLAYHEDEWQVLKEFAALAETAQVECSLLSVSTIASRFPAIVTDNLKGGLFSPVEVTIDPRQVMAGLPDYLHETYGVAFVWNCLVTGVTLPQIETTQGQWQAERVVICTGHDFRDLLPDLYRESGIIPCKLQMMRTQAYGHTFRLGVMLAAGLTLRHYASFQQCPSLPQLHNRLEQELPEYGRYGIHVLVSQNGDGEVLLGDSHEYGEAIEPFDKAAIDELVLRYLQSMVHLRGLQIAARWHGIYGKHPQLPWVVARPNDRTLAVTGVGGAGMTLSMELAEHLISQW